MMTLSPHAEEALNGRLDMSPGETPANPTNGSVRYPELFGESLCGEIAGPDLSNLAFHQEMHPVRLSTSASRVETSHADAMFDIPFPRDPLKVFHPIIVSDGVDMVDLMAGGWRAEKCFGNQSMNKTRGRVRGEINGQVPVSRPQIWFQYSSDLRSPCGGVSFDFAHTRDGVFREANDLEPVGLFHV